MAVGDYPIAPFISPVGLDIATIQTRGNDNVLRDKFVAHQDDTVAHIQNGTLAARPATAVAGTTYFCTDTQDTYTYVGAAWVQTGWAHWYGTVFDTTDQYVPAAGAPYRVTFDSSGLLRGVTLTNSGRVNVTYAGDYNVQFSSQLTNTDANESNCVFFLSKNGTMVADTAGYVTVPKKHGSGDGHGVVSWNVYLTLAANDYVELYWQAGAVTTYLDSIAATANIPRSPSAILTINRI